MKKIIIILFLISFFPGCSFLINKNLSKKKDQINSKLSDTYISCTGYGDIKSIGILNGQLSFNFFSQNDSSFLQFNDFLGRKILLLWLTPNSISAWNILENKRYDDNNIKDFFPLLSAVGSNSITKFLWGNISKDFSENLIDAHKNLNEVVITFEKSNNYLTNNLIDKATFNDDNNKQNMSIVLKSRVFSYESINLSKMWKLKFI